MTSNNCDRCGSFGATQVKLGPFDDGEMWLCQPCAKEAFEVK